MRWFLLPLLLISTWIHAAVNAVGVRVGESAGTGLAMSRGVDCFIVTVNHLVDKPYDIRIIGRGRRQAAAEVVVSDELNDLAILSLPRDNPICGADTPLNLEQTDAALASVTTGYLLGADETGSEYRANVTVSAHDEDFVMVRSMAGVYLAQTMSGSILFVNGWPVGMLQSIDGQGRARVLRFERIASEIESFLPIAIDRDTRNLNRGEADFDVRAAERLQRHVGFLQSREFCEKLFAWAYRLSQDKYSDVGYLSQTAPDTYVYRDALVPGTDSELERTPRGDKTWRELKTNFGQRPGWPHIGPILQTYGDAIQACTEIKELKKANKFRSFVRRRRTQGGEPALEWELEYTGFLGATMGNVTIKFNRIKATDLVLVLRDVD